jgi:hypothetical protein
VVEGSACTLSIGPGKNEYAALATGGLAQCQGGEWVGAAKFKAAGQACSAAEENTTATDGADKQALICKQGRYLRAAALVSNFVLVESQKITFGPGVSVLELNKPTCPDSGGLSAQTRLTLSLMEGSPVVAGTPAAPVSGVNVYADASAETNPKWTVHLERSLDTQALGGVVLASMFCFYQLE